MTGAKASGYWNLMSLKPAPRKRRSDAAQGKKLTRRMITAIKTRLLNNSRLTVAELQGKVPGLSAVTRQWVNYVILHKIGLKQRSADCPYNTEIVFISPNKGKLLSKDF